jgi:putative oxygen-independent coproporphyrinogen III oxidase
MTVPTNGSTNGPLPPLALYAHFPWCVAKCPYCDFNSFALQGSLPEAQYIEALQRDLDAQLVTLDSEQAGGRPIVSIFLGGGTPSLFSPDAIGGWLTSLRERLTLADDVEITLEANPGTIERGRFAGYRDAGITRVSLGAQSFGAAQLRALGRIHSADETRRAAEELHAAGLTNFNIDLMYALPDQTIDAALYDIDQALSLQPAHLSHYQLTLEVGTPFAARPPPNLPEDDTAEQMLTECLPRLEANGFRRYEVSAYARAGAQCRHNLNYWRFGDYLGIGAGAHGKVTSRVADAAHAMTGGVRIRRSTQLREPRRYLGAVPQALQSTWVEPDQLPFEFMLNGLRLLEGFGRADFERGTGLAWQQIEATVEDLCQRGLLESGAAGVRPSARGLAFLNDALVRFLPDKTET